MRGGAGRGGAASVVEEECDAEHNTAVRVGDPSEQFALNRGLLDCCQMATKWRERADELVGTLVTR